MIGITFGMIVFERRRRWMGVGGLWLSCIGNTRA
ncbi:hypothetical protein BRADI_1g60345v3 [Brachypodium distachyon]|uniref:Uncharacterized protein n=1 Tax=Brachypodium distachyon TaxID=15368 RepID=A0A0Q3HFP7_BRADI|nr:hypothetical protein BRADI_1g60345v3 [Brachypodium distachyon]